MQCILHAILRHFSTWHFDTRTCWHPTFLTPRHLDNKTCCHPDIVLPRNCATAVKSRHFDTQTFCIQDILPLHSFWHPDILQPKLYPTPPTILLNSYDLGTALTATIGPAGQSRVFFYWVRPTSLMMGPIIQHRFVLRLLYPTPSSIITIVTWVQRMQAWPSANSAHRLAFGKTLLNWKGEEPRHKKWPGLPGCMQLISIWTHWIFSFCFQSMISVTKQIIRATLVSEAIWKCIR